jgi:hypothetical protein
VLTDLEIAILQAIDRLTPDRYGEANGPQVVCCPSHRTEANRIQAILNGRSSGPYDSLAARFKAAREPFVRFGRGVSSRPVMLAVSLPTPD